jgi:diguanylate cyclase (GGDEF)-like protein
VWGNPRKIEWVLAGSVAGLSLLLASTPTLRYPVLSLYFLPTGLAGMLGGRHRVGQTVLLSIVSAVVAVWHQSTVLEWLGLGVWGGVLGLQAVIIGSLSDSRRREMARLTEAHRTDTLSDALTGVANRRAFEYELTRRVMEWNRQRSALSLILLDIDHFKRLNDTYGHPAGDEVLRRVAEVLSEQCRETDLVSRYGGEEFVIVMPNTPGGEARRVAERVRESIELSQCTIDGHPIQVTISLGVAEILRGEQREDLVRRADQALYASKQLGRNCCHFHDGNRNEQFGKTPARPVPSLTSRQHDHYADALTGLPTRRVFEEELRRRLAESRRYDGPLSVMLVQVDDFDAPGGMDRELRRQVNALVAECLREVLRDVDLIARFDEDQFAVLMPNTHLEEAFIPAERLRLQVCQSRRLQHAGVELQLTVSLALAAPHAAELPASILQRTLDSLWHAVRGGGNRLLVHEGLGAVATASNTAIANPRLAGPVASNPAPSSAATRPHVPSIAPALAPIFTPVDPAPFATGVAVPEVPAPPLFSGGDAPLSDVQMGV